jgi:hypothetical protein
MLLNLMHNLNLSSIAYDLHVLAQGKFEDSNAEAKKIFQIDTFEGIRMEYQRGLNNSFGVSHVAHFGGSPESPATYEFCANFSKDKVFEDCLVHGHFGSTLT